MRTLAILTALVLGVQVPAWGQERFAPVPQDTVYIDLEQVMADRAVHEQSAQIFRNAGGELVGGCMFGEVRGPAGGTYLHVDSLLIQSGCVILDGVVGVFATWNQPVSPVNDPTALYFLNAMLDENPKLVFVAIMYDIVILRDPDTGEPFPSTRLYFALRTRQ